MFRSHNPLKYSKILEMNRKKLLLLILTFFFMAVVSYFYYLQSVSYSFVDEFDNIVAAHFMIQGKTLFASIFHNRQIGPVYISYFLQQILQPSTLYQLILYHRLFIVAISFAMSILIVWRFGLVGMLTVFMFETIKLSSFGNFFQAEAMIVYPALYLFGLMMEGFEKKKMNSLDLIIAGVFAWFILFSREAYTPLVLFMLLMIFLRTRSKKLKILLAGISIILSVVTLATVSLKDYIFQIIYVNSQNKLLQGEFNLLKSFFYPVYIFFPTGSLTYTRIVELLFASVFVTLVLVRKKWKEALLIMVALGLAVLRTIPPGSDLYPAYKMLVWYVLFFYAVFHPATIEGKNKYFRYIYYCVLTTAFAYAVLASNLFHPIDRAREFNIAYNRYTLNGEVINALAAPEDTLFVDGYDSLLYWSVRATPSFKYAMYYPILEGIQPFEKERLAMFHSNPPTFYYRDCISKNALSLPHFVRSEYKNFKQNKSSTCLYVHKDKLPMNENQEKELKDKFGYHLD